MRRNPPSSLLRAVAPLIVAGTLTAAASAAAGIEPVSPSPLPDSAFAPVTVPAQAIGERGLIVVPPPSPQALTDAALSPQLRAELRSDVVAHLASQQPDRVDARVREPEPIVIQVAPPKPAASQAPATSHSLSGRASWYCRAGVSPCTYTHPDGGGFDAYAAAGPKLRAAIGPAWRGSIVWVDGIRVQLIDWCQCYKGEPQEKLLDLYYDVYARTGGSVTIRW